MWIVMILLGGFWFSMLGAYIARTDKIAYVWMLCSLICLAMIVYLFILEAIEIYGY